MSTREAQNKTLMRRYLEATIAGDQTDFREMLATDFVAHVGGSLDREAFLKHNNGYTAAFSDRHITVEDLIAEEDMVWARITWQGVHTGDMRGIPPTGKQVAVGAIVIERIRDGKIVEHWSLFDTMGMMQQLGLMPVPAQAGS
jgi:steroid delta-isomerase-like uncharacterized protein